MRPAAVNLGIAVLCLIWGSTWVVIRGGLHHLPPLTSATARFALAALVMTLVARLLAGREGGGRPPLHLVVALGLLNFAASYGIVYRAEVVLPSGLVSVLWAVFPMTMAASGHFFLPGERLSLRQWLGFCVGFGGVVVLFVTDIARVGPEGIPAALVLLLSPLVCVVGTTLVKRDGGGVSSLLLNRDAMWLAAAVLAVFALLTEHDAPARWTAPALLSVGYLALAGTVVTFGLYFWLMRSAPAHRMSLISYVTPALALVLGHLVEGEPLGPTTVAGTVLIVLGVGLGGHR